MQPSGIQASRHTAFLSLWAKMAARAPAITSMSQATGWKKESEKGQTPPFEGVF